MIAECLILKYSLDLAWSMRRLGRYFRRRSSKSYNSRNWGSAAFNGRIAWIFGEAKGLDIAARSKIRMGRHKEALRIYDLAESYGLRLRDHFVNKCRCQLSLDRIVDAFETLQRFDPLQDYDPIPTISKSLRSYNQAERRDIILDMMAIADVPDELTVHLSEWSRAAVTRKHAERTVVEIDSEIVEEQVVEEEIEGSEAIDQNDSEEVSEDESVIGNPDERILSVRSSAEYVLGSVIVDAYRKPSKIPALPFKLLREGLRLRSERLPGNNELDPDPTHIEYKPSNSILFFPTNGVGFGHFARCYAIAERIRRKDPNVEIVFLTTMPTLHFLSDIGALAYHLPGRYRYADMSPAEWNSMFAELFLSVLRHHRPKAFLFDGAYPYKGMTDVLKKLKNVDRYWLRRAGENNAAKPLPEGRMSVFDFVLRPGDSVHIEAINEVDSLTKLVRCDPILLSDQENIFPKGSLRKRLGIPEEAVLAYVQLGAGKINEISDELKNSLDAISNHPSAYIVYGESVIGERRIFDHPRIRTLRDFPNSRYFADIDFAIMAGGYNSYHEAVQFSIPTIMFPNLKTKRDDQSARVKAAGDMGCMIVLKNRTRESIIAAVDRIMDDDIRRNMRVSFEKIEVRNGAQSIADLIRG